MNQTKHKTTDMIRRYIRLDNIRQHNAAQSHIIRSERPTLPKPVKLGAVAHAAS
jgi:hypothetical protein